MNTFQHLEGWVTEHKGLAAGIGLAILYLLHKFFSRPSSSGDSSGIPFPATTLGETQPGSLPIPVGNTPTIPGIYDQNGVILPDVGSQIGVVGPMFAPIDAIPTQQNPAAPVGSIGQPQNLGFGKGLQWPQVNYKVPGATNPQISITQQPTYNGVVAGLGTRPTSPVWIPGTQSHFNTGSNTINSILDVGSSIASIGSIFSNPGGFLSGLFGKPAIQKKPDTKLPAATPARVPNPTIPYSGNYGGPSMPSIGYQNTTQYGGSTSAKIDTGLPQTSISRAYYGKVF